MTKSLDVSEEHSDLIDENAIHQSQKVRDVAVGKPVTKPSWTGDLQELEMDDALHELCTAFNNSPFLSHNFMRMQVGQAGHIECVVDMAAELIGNVAFRILHGGVAATMLDSVGGIQGMAQILAQEGLDSADKVKKIGRLATVDMRVDYLSPGKGKVFTATAEVIRLGRKGCTSKMKLVNDAGKTIAVGTASYAF